VLDVTDASASAFAIDLGIGMQLTNICRDVQEDARMGRRYLPSEVIGKVSLQELVDPPLTQQGRLRVGMEYLLNLADEYYHSGESGLPFLPLRARHGILIAAKVYRAIGVKLREQDFNYWEGRTVISKGRKVRITLAALAGSFMGAGFWRQPLRHKAELHRALKGLPRVDSHYGL
jgi:phytoene synthase